MNSIHLPLCGLVYAETSDETPVHGILGQSYLHFLSEVGVQCRTMKHSRTVALNLVQGSRRS